MTAQITGMYGQQYQSMGMMVPSTMLAESLMGGAMGRGAAIGGPMMQGAAGMMGLDPMSMGIRAASFGVQRLGMGALGGGMMGLGAATGAGVAAMGVGYAANQMFQGAQNQMAFGNGMRQNFAFMRQDGTGQGFNRSDLSSISNTLQSMTHSYGPGGETMGFGELSKLAQNMGKMGMANGVQDAKDFSRKFKEMVTTLKTVATELGTSLEAAQELMSSARGSGIFKTGDQLKFSGAIRSTGLAGNLSTSELTGMANVGSRISRAFGGLGGAGAMGGIKALGQVGIATQVGALSEEDIYNATGATGAEGRAAMASEMLQNTGNFLKTSKGRWFLASVAGKDGRLNSDAVSEYMYGGGMGTDRTKQLAHQNLSGIGRANFIRNEGRLRGQVMEQMGGLAPAVALMGWAQQRGININDMDDRSMLFAQRHLGMGRDELDATVKMAQALPDIMERQRNTSRNDEYVQGRTQYNKSRDVRTRLEHIRHGIQEKLQSVGQDLFQSGSEMIESTMNKLLGQFESYASRDIEEVARAAKLGGAGGAQRFNERFGTQAGVFGMSGAQVSKATDRFMQRSSYNAGDPSKRQEAMRLQGLADAADYGSASKGTMDYIGANKADLLRAYGQGIAGKSGDQRTAAVSSYLETKAKQGDVGAQRMLTEMRTNPAKAAGVVGAMERELGIDKGSGLGASYGKGSMFAGQGGWSSQERQNFDVGGVFTGRSNEEIVEAGGLGSQLKIAGGVLSASVVNMGIAAKDLIMGTGKSGDYERRLNAINGEAYASVARNSDFGKLQGAIGKAFNDPSASKLIRDLASGKDPTDAYLRMSNLAGKKDATPEERGELAALKATDYGKRYADLKRQGNQVGIDALLKEVGEDPTMKEALAGTGMGEGVLEKMSENVAGALGMQARIDRNKQADSWIASSGKDLAGMKRLGILTQKEDGNFSLSSKTRGQLTKDGSQAAEMAIDLLNKQQALAGLPDEEKFKKMNEIAKGYEAMGDKMASWSIEDKRKFAKSMAGTEAGDMALDMIGRQQKFEGINRATRGNVGATAARFLGINLGKEKEGLLEGKSAKEISEILGQTVGGDASFKGDLEKALEAAKKGSPNAGNLLSKAMAGASQEVKDKIVRAQKEQDDPLQADIAKESKLQTKYLEVLAKVAGKTDPQLLEAINKIGGEGVEKKP